MANLVVDWGNTFIKAGWFSGEILQENFTQWQESDLIHWIHQQKPDFTLISSVNRMDENFLKKIQSHTQYLLLQSDTLLPIQNRYDTPHTLGMDRLAAAVGAFELYPERNCLIIDAGTCITFDFLDSEGNFQGGNISLGLQMRFKALHEFTAKLPLINPDEFTEATLTGKSTKEAIFNGVVQGIIGETLHIIDEYRQKFEDLAVLVCGGDYRFFETRLKVPIFAIPNLTLVGLNRILSYNVEEFF
jgi:type III pantothenate kinase